MTANFIARHNNNMHGYCKKSMPKLLQKVKKCNKIAKYKINIILMAFPYTKLNQIEDNIDSWNL